MLSNPMMLLDMLSNNDVTFFIPPYQRNYEWTDDQCEVFFEDVEKTGKSNKSGERTQHFFGTITYFQTERPFGQPKELVLIDGQQRITTTMLFLCAMRDVLEDQKIKDYINTKYLKNNNANTDDNTYKIKLKQVETDWGVYVDLILQNEIKEAEKNTCVYRNYKYFLNKLLSYKKSGKDPADLIGYGLDKFSVISIELEPDRNKWENPQEIFESLNSLGKPLSLADLVRNYLLLGFDSHTQDQLYKEYWLHIEKTIPGQISNYIRDFMQWYSKVSYKKRQKPIIRNYTGFLRIFFRA